MYRDQRLREELLADRSRAISQCTRPLPGSVPYENRRPLNVSLKHDRETVLKLLSSSFPEIEQQQWLQRFQAGLILIDGKAAKPTQIVRSGQRLVQVFPATVEPDVNANIQIIFEDDSIVIVNKPAPLPMHPCGRFNRNSLISILNQVFSPVRLRIVHRLDANTTGIVVFCKSKEAAANLHSQFVAGRVQKKYVTKIQGPVTWNRFCCDASISTRPTKTGARVVSDQGQAARTEFEVVRTLESGHAIVLASPLTGRTNQIRIHLWHMGTPILGDTTYSIPGEIGHRQTIHLGDPPLCLHAWSIKFQHPKTNAKVEFEATQPAWAGGLS